MFRWEHVSCIILFHRDSDGKSPVLEPYIRAMREDKEGRGRVKYRVDPRVVRGQLVTVHGSS